MQPQPQPEQGFRLNLFGVMGGIIALVSLVLPWVTFLGIVSENLISLVPETLGSRPIDVAESFGGLFAVIFVVMGGFSSLVSPYGGIPSLLGGVVFLAAFPNFVGVGPIVAIIGGILALAGFFFPGLVRVIPLHATAESGNFQPVAQPSQAGSQQTTTPPPNRRFCPTCGAHYPGDYKVCPRDTTELKELQVG